jgi:hypothetical protein
MTSAARRVDQILSDTPLAANLLARLAAARHAARVIAPIGSEVVPGLDLLRPGTVDLRDGVLRIWLRSSAHSTKLRQAAPRLLAALQGQGVEVNEIRVGVQLGRVRETPAAEARNRSGPTSKSGPMVVRDRSELDALSSFSRKLVLTFPESPLGRAAARLGKAIDSQLARMRESDQPFQQQNREKQDTDR